MNMGTIVGAIVSVTVSVIIIASVLAPTVLEYTKEGGALAEWSGLISAIIVISLVATLMICVKLITTKD